MKALLIIFTLGSTLLFSCNSGQQKATPVTKASAKILAQVKPGKHCYLALFEKDSASLSFTITKTGEIKGQLNINYNADTAAAHQPTAGEITGEFRGDTLFADYNFTSGKEKYINPIAFLFKNDTLIMGHGKIYDYLGRTYFDDKTPIDYTKSRFHFAPTACK